MFLFPMRASEQDKVIGVGVHIYVYNVCLWTKKKFESYFSDRLTFSNIHDRTSCRIYKLALPLLSPETLSLLSKYYLSAPCSICPKDDIITVAQFHW